MSREMAMIGDEMPYKLSANGKGKTVMVHKDGKWVKLKAHPTHEKALAHLRALEVNVEEAKKK